MKYFSYKTALVLFVFLALGAGIFGALYMKPASPSKLTFNQDSVEKATALVAEMAIKDTDGDGLKDWEEALWKSDVQNPDTDGDGTLDGDEVRAGRDPAKAGPNDEITPGTPESISVESLNTPSTTNLSEILAESFQPVYDVLAEDGDLTLSQEDELYELISKEFSGRAQKLPSTPLYRFQDLTILSNPTPEQVQSYVDSLILISNSYAERHQENPLAIVNNAFKIGDGSGLIELRAIAKTYQDIAEDLLGLQVPIDIAQNHLDLINIYVGMVDDLGKMRKMQEDPLSGIVGITSYQENLSSLVALMDSFNTFFSNTNEPL